MLTPALRPRGRSLRPARLLALLVLLLTSLSPTSPATAAELPAFPGAEGHGAHTPGGRGGVVIAVTSLAASGPGSLRAAVEAQGPRIVVFRIGGTIRQTRILEIRDPYITIAGQTAPGDGITIRGPGIAVMTHDVIIRGLRIRVGAEPGVSYGSADGLRVDGGSNVIVDHCSFSWGVDENLSTSTYSGPTHNVTFQWNIVSEALYHSAHPEGAHSMGLLISEGSAQISVHHNLLADNNQRNPLVKGDADVEFVNNVVYNWRELASEFVDPEGYGPSVANLIGNVYKAGPSTSGERPVRVRSTALVYLKGNSGVADAGVIAATPGGLSIEGAGAAYEAVLADAGGTAPRRDLIDARVVGEVRDGRGRIIDSPSEVGGWLTMAAGSPPADGDGDGMPDSWEQERELNPHDAADRNSVLPGGYTAVETYVNSLISVAAGGQLSALYLPLAWR
jgi:pectate lyase